MRFARLTCQMIALLICLVAGTLWLLGGLNKGWTKTTEPIKKIDPVTEQEYVEWEKTFSPGIDFLAGSLLAAGLVGGASLFFSKRKH